MNCSEFVARLTDYLDGSAPPGDVRAIEEHLRACGSCRRYRTVVEHGASLLRSLPAPQLRDDFGPRLQHRLYNVLEERALVDQGTSRTPALTVLGMAVVLTVVAWSPLLRGDSPVVQLEPIVVDHAPRPLQLRPASSQDPSLGLGDLPDLDRQLWEDMRLYDHSPLSRRYDDGAQNRRVGFAPDR